MKAHIIRDSDGRRMYFGHIYNKKQLIEADGVTPKAGYSLLPSTTLQPSEDLFEPMWDGVKWIAGPADIAKEQRTAERQAAIDKLKAEPDRLAGEILTSSELLKLIGAK